VTDPQEIRRRLADPFPPDVMGWKAQTTTQDKQRALAVAYIDARDVMDRLDDVVGVDGWEDAYAELPAGVVLCTLRVRIGSIWVSKQDVGGESDQPDKGDKAKAAHSDALKRAAVKYGRYLYSLPAVWCPYDAQKKQLSQTPTLPAWAMPGGSGRPHKATAPVNAPRAQLSGTVDNLGARQNAIEAFRECPDLIEFMAIGVRVKALKDAGKLSDADCDAVREAAGAAQDRLTKKKPVPAA
jgi:hypothetical protein